MPGGAFRRSPAILPRMLDELFPRREAAKKAGDDVASNAIKILMNSFYGVLGTPACRFYNPALANSITGTGREMLLWSKRWFEAAGFDVLYGDTDSLFVHSHSDDPDAAFEQAREARGRLERRVGPLYQRALARAEPDGARVREALSEVVSAARAPQHARGEQALRRVGPRSDGRG